MARLGGGDDARRVRPITDRKPKPILSVARVLLRQPRPSDGDERLALGSDAEILRMFGVDAARAPRLTIEGAEAWLHRLATHPHAWIIEHDGRFLGEARLDGIDPNDGRASLAVGLCDPGKLGIGLGREVVRLVLHHAFRKPGLHRVGLRVAAYNTRAVRCYLACGFVLEGREREAVAIAGRRHDDLLMGILACEFAP